MTGQHDDRAFDTLFAQQAAQFPTIGVGQAHVQNHKIIDRFFDTLHRGGYAFGEDYSVVQAAALVFTVGYVGVNFVVDLAYYALDPRIRHG